MAVECIVCDTEIKGDVCPFCGTLRDRDSDVAGALPAGALLQGGTFAVGRVLGAGGFGITYVGVDRQLRRLVAIKEFFPQGSQRAGRLVTPGFGLSPAAFTAARDRFAHEARVAARFQHPNIVHVYTFFEENGTGYMVMELLQGRTLHDLIEAHGALSQDYTLWLAAQIAEALRVVHAAGFVHRDVKPDNVLLTDDGRVVLLDFGTAKAQLTSGRPVTALVSPGYAPPEQYLPSRAPDARGDVYSLAATLYHVVTGVAPAEAPARTAGEPLVDPRAYSPTLRPSVADALLSALSLDPTQRPTTIEGFVTRLHADAPPPAEAAPSHPPSPPHAAIPAVTTVPSPSLPYAPDLAASLPSTAGAGGVTTQVPTAPPPATPLAPVTASAMPAPVLTPLARMAGHRGMVRAVDFTLDGQWIVSGSEDRTVRLWGTRSRESHGVVAELDDWVSALRVCPAGRLAAIGSNDKTVRLIDLETRETVRIKQCGSPVQSVAWSPDGRWLASSFLDGRIVLFDSECNELHQAAPSRDSIRGLVVSPDGRRLAFGTGTDARIHTWDVQSWRESGVFEGVSGSVRCLSWSSDGAFIAAASTDLAIHLYTAEGRKIATLKGTQGRVNALAFHPFGPYLASGGADKCIRLWDVQGARCVQTVNAHEGEVLAVAWSRDGRLLASGSQDDQVAVLEGSA